MNYCIIKLFYKIFFDLKLFFLPSPTGCLLISKKMISTPGMSPAPPDYESQPSPSMRSIQAANGEMELRLMIEAQEREIKRLVGELSESKIKCEETSSAMRQLISSNEGLEKELKTRLQHNNSEVDIIRGMKYEIESLTLKLSAAERRELQSQQIASHSQGLLASACSELERIYAVAPLQVLPTLNQSVSITMPIPPVVPDQLETLRAEVSQTQTDYNSALKALHETRQVFRNPPNGIKSP